MDFILHSPVFRGISGFKHRKTEHCVKRENEDDAGRVIVFLIFLAAVGLTVASIIWFLFFSG